MPEINDHSPRMAPGATGDQKYILFKLDEEDYCVPILQTQEVIAEYQLTSLPNLPTGFKGVLSLRGEPVPVLNLRQRFGLAPRVEDKNTRVIIVEFNGQPLGVEVDRVSRVMSFGSGEIESAPESIPDATRTFSGVRELPGGKFAIILDISAIVTSSSELNLGAVRQSIVEQMQISAAPPEPEAAPETN